jgi:hypothetical protein
VVVPAVEIAAPPSEELRRFQQSYLDWAFQGTDLRFDEAAPAGPFDIDNC